jgi:hypothetical protein
MSEPRYSWNQPICEKDWIDQRVVTTVVDGIEVVVDIPVPMRMVSEHVAIERCSWCGEPTIFGAYVRADPATVPFPAPKVD